MHDVLSLQFKQRGYTESSMDRQSATTTGQMLNQVTDSQLMSATLPKNMFAATSSVANRRHPVMKDSLVFR